MSYRRIWLEWIFLFTWAPLSQAQSNSRSSINIIPRTCSDIQVIVKDSNGLTIEGAVISTESVELITDIRGRAVFPCNLYKSVSAVIEVCAAGYRRTRVPFQPDSASYFEVRLEKENPVTHPVQKTISVRQLPAAVKSESLTLQKQARDALATGDYGNAETLLLRALDLTPSSASILNNLGVAAARQNKKDSAEMWFERAAQANPGEPEAFGNLGLIRWSQHRPEESYDLLSKAASMKYETSAGNYIMAMVCMGKGLYGEAVRHLKKVPADRFPLRDLYLSLVLQHCGKAKAASDAHRKFLKHRRASYAVSALPQELN
jgi:Tfp pilus assembly protein PilF